MHIACPMEESSFASSNMCIVFTVSSQNDFNGHEMLPARSRMTETPDNLLKLRDAVEDLVSI